MARNSVYTYTVARSDENIKEQVLDMLNNGTLVYIEELGDY